MKSLQIGKLLLMALLHYIVMYIVMYAMVHTSSDVYLNLNNIYMAGMMTAPMLVIEGVVMYSMYEAKKVLGLIMAGSVGILLIFYLCVRQQIGVGDTQFLRSMIPHHSGAILMCQEASITDTELQALCQTIIQSQQSEIDQMKAILERRYRTK